MHIRFFCVATYLVLTFPASAALQLAPLFCDHAVLQQGKPVPVWGTADAGMKISVSFKGQKAEGVADDKGNWQVSLPELPASADPADLVVTGGDQTVKIGDIVVGEVWLCSGQSNMEWRVMQVADAQKEIASADYPLIRQFRVPKETSAEPLRQIKSSWVSASPATVSAFSGVAYFFARDLYQNLKIPIGLINASFGGKMIEVFLSPDALAGSPSLSAVEKRWSAEQATLLAKAKEAPGVAAGPMEQATVAEPAAHEEGKAPAVHRLDPRVIVEQHRPSGLYNAMIHPLIPYSIRGVIWYQGEQNISRPGEYRGLFTAMITDWRQKFQQGDFPFYFVQLSAFNASLDKTRVGFSLLREAQFETLSVPHTAMAVTVDIGNEASIHPTDKQDVGARLARIAKAQTYHLGGVWSGPVFRGMTVEGKTLVLAFDHTEGGLKSSEAPMPGFEIAGADGQFQPAQAEIKGETVVVRSDAVTAPTSVRYAWGDFPPAPLYNGEGLPAVPFRASL